MNNEETKKKVNKKGNTNNKGKKNNNASSKKSTTNTKKNTTKKNTNPKKSTVKEEVVKKVEVKEEVVKEVVKEEKVTPKETSKNKVNTDIFLVIGLIVVVIIGFFAMGNTKEEEATYELPLKLSGEAGMHQLTYQAYQDKIDNNESFVVILERATCSHCVSFMPVATEFATNKNLPMYYVDTDTFSQDDWTKFEKSNSYLKKAKGKWGTPTTVVLAGKTAVDSIEGETTAEKLEELYNKYFTIGE